MNVNPSRPRAAATALRTVELRAPTVTHTAGSDASDALDVHHATLREEDVREEGEGRAEEGGEGREDAGCRG